MIIELDIIYCHLYILPILNLNFIILLQSLIYQNYINKNKNKNKNKKICYDVGSCCFAVS